MPRHIGAVVLSAVLLAAAPVWLHAQASPAVTIVVTAPAPPASTRITSPEDGATKYKVGDLLTITAVAPPGTGVLEFFSNGLRLGESKGPDYKLQVKIGTLGVKALTVRPQAPPPPPPQSGTRIQADALTYLGGFKGPTWNGADPKDSIDYGGYGLAFNAEHHSLFVIGHIGPSFVSEITIPATLSADPVTMQRAAFLQAPADMVEGKRFGDLLVGLLVYHGRLVASSRVSYDANHSQNALKKSHYVSGLDLSKQGDALGPLEVTSAATNYLTGYMATVPQPWQAALGGPALTGWCCGPSIVGRTSQGPAVAAFDPDKLGVADPVPGNDLVYYPLDHPTLGDWRTQGSTSPWPPSPGQAENHVYNGTAEVNGLAFPDGSRSVLFFGHIGQGMFCYGDLTCDASKVYTLFGPPENGLRYCALRPDCPNPDQGHSYYSIDGKKGFAPTLFQVWAYDAGDLATVKAGTVKPWEVKPYAYWTLTIPAADYAKGSRIRAVAYDPAGQRIYLYQQQYGDTYIHVFQVKVP